MGARKKPLEIRVMRNHRSACREYLHVSKMAEKSGDLVSSSYARLRIEFTDRVVEFVPVGSLDFCVRGRAISSYTVASDLQFSESTRQFLEIAVAAGKWNSHA